MTAACGNLDLLERIWLWAGEVQRNPHLFKIILLLDQYKDGQIVWHIALAGGHVEMLGRLWSRAKEEPIK